MASIADLLGVQWEAAPAKQNYRLSEHAKKQATTKGFDHAQILAAANNPTHTYDNNQKAYPGQKRHIRGDYVAVVDPAKGHVITSYLNVKDTELREDQKAAGVKKGTLGKTP